MQGLQTWARKGFDAYPAGHAGKTICVLVPQGIGPAALAKASFDELAAKVNIFRKCAYGYRKVWPTYSVLGTPRFPV